MVHNLRQQFSFSLLFYEAVSIRQSTLRLCCYLRVKTCKHLVALWVSRPPDFAKVYL